MSAFRAALEAADGAPEALERAVNALRAALGCAVAVTEWRAPAGAIVRSRTHPDGFRNTLGEAFLRRAAARLAQRARALTLDGSNIRASAGAIPNWHYLGIPAPREAAAQYALHLFSKSPFSRAQRQAARAAADCLGAWALRSGTAANATQMRLRQSRAHIRDPMPGTISAQQLLRDAVRGAAEALGADTCSLMVMEQSTGELVVEAVHGLDEAEMRTGAGRSSPGIASYVMSSGQPVILGDPQQDPRLAGLELRPRRDIRCSLCIPFALSSGLRGIVNFNRMDSPEAFTVADMQLGCAVAAQLGVCVASARACPQAESASSADAQGAASAHRILRRDLDHLHYLYAAVQRLSANSEPHSITAQLAHEVAALTGSRAATYVPLPQAANDAAADAPQSEGDLLILSATAAAVAHNLAGPLLLEQPVVTTSSETALLAGELAQQIGSGAMLILPCAHGRTNLGLVVAWNLSRTPDERELSLAAGLCGHGAALLRQAIDREAAVNERSLELSALYQLCGEISTATTFESALRSVLEIARSMVPYDEGLVFMWNEETSRLELAACRGADLEAMRQQAPQHQPGNMYQWVFAESKALISTDVAQQPREAERGGQVLRSSMAVPLVVGNQTIGVLAIHSALPRAYTEQHVKVLSIVASQAAAIYRALQSLGRLSRYTDQILQSIVAGVVGLDRAGRVVMWSPAAAQILGCGAEAAVGTDFQRLARDLGRHCNGPAGGTVESLGLVAQRVLAHGEPVLEHELHLEHDGRAPRALLADCTPLRDGEGQLAGAVLLIEDVTERKRMEDRMRQMSQLAAVGHLAANVAHEIRNPLSAIKTAAQFLSTEHKDDPLIAQFAGIINQECDRLSKVAADFLTFARPSEPTLEHISLASVVNRALALTAPEMFERKIRIKWQPPKRLRRVWADAEAMHQVFVNLLVNAAQAIGREGEITVTLRTLRAEQGGPALEAAIADSGCGIAEHDLERIWTPFFSTKTKGTGLGLSIVRKTVEAHGGQVWAEAGKSGGAIFRLRLPLQRPPQPKPGETVPEVGTPDTRPRWVQLGLPYHDQLAPPPAAQQRPAAAGRGAQT